MALSPPLGSFKRQAQALMREKRLAEAKALLDTLCAGHADDAEVHNHN